MYNDIEKSVEQAKHYLLIQAREDFAETRHEMSFPKRAGFGGKKERCSSDIFVRAVLASILLDIISLNAKDSAYTAMLKAIVHREADYIAEGKLRDRAGGWSYFADLPDLPPDLDSLSAALRLFVRAAPEHLPLCQEPLQLALENFQSDGGLETWLISPGDPPQSRHRMKKGIKRFWGNGVHLDVCAHFLWALSEYDFDTYGDILHRGARFIADHQDPDGSWRATWYWGDAYGTVMCLSFLDQFNHTEWVHKQAIDFFLTSQRHNGGWGIWESVPLDTALAIWAITKQDSCIQQPDVINRAIACLLNYQCEDGRWNPSAWIKMDVGRAQNSITHTLTYQSATLSTALCLRSLLKVAHIYDGT